MSISRVWGHLPRTIKHCGYVFQLEMRSYRGIQYVGYFVAQCESKRKDKKNAFKLGFWVEKDPKRHTSSHGTPIFTGIPLMGYSDDELLRSLTALHRNLIYNFGYTPPISAENTTFDTEFEEIIPLSIPGLQ